MNRILFISFSGPYPVKDGKRQRTAALLQALSEKYEVDFLILGNQADFNLALKKDFGPRIHFFFLPFKRTSFEQFLHLIGFVFVPNSYLTHRISVFCNQRIYVFAFCRYIHPVPLIRSRIPIVADIDDDWEEIYQSRLTQSSSWYKRFRLRQVIFLNSGAYKKLLERLNLGFVVKACLEANHLRVLPNLPFQLIQSDPISFSSCIDQKILFIGKLSYDPNLFGIKWFIREVFSLLVLDHPNVSLTIVSNVEVKDIEFEYLIKKYPSIELKIDLDDLVKVYQTHSISIAPIMEGSGSNIKIAESLWMGRPVVSTPFGMRGYEEEAENSILVPCKTPQEFCNQIKHWFNYPEELQRLQSRSYEFSKERYSFKNWSKSLLTEVERVGN